MKTVIVNLMVMRDNLPATPQTIIFRNVLSTKECTSYLRIRVQKYAERKDGIVETSIPHGRIIEYAIYPEGMEPNEVRAQ